MLNPLAYLNRPEYLWRPRQTLRRFGRIGKAKPERAEVTLPWGATLTVHTGEIIGSALYHYGIFDKIVPEALWRVLDRGDTAVEVGANIGQNCSLMAAKAGPTGRVLAFEPHPEIFDELKRNCEHWRRSDLAPIRLERLAMGAAAGEAILAVGEAFASNRGSATLQTNAVEGQGFKVQVRQLDMFLDGVDHIGACKIDVEGQELEVLRGAERALQRCAIRDIVFEDFADQPSSVTEFLQRHGFTVFELHDSWLKPRLIPAGVGAPARRGFSFNYLATLDPARALARFRTPGWHCLLNL